MRALPKTEGFFTPAAKRLLTPMWIGVAVIRKDNERLRRENRKLKMRITKLEGKA